MSSHYKIRITKKECDNYRSARLQISVGQQYHEGGKFLATTEWLAAAPFETISINLCDTLQRHNLMYHGYSPFAAFDKALQNGKEWLERNKAALQLIPDAKITHWETWKKNPDWDQAQSKTSYLYENDQIFCDLVEKSVEEFWKRRQGKDGYTEDRKDDFFLASRNYILEEIAVSMIMSQPDIAEIYPGTFPLPLYHLRDIGISAPSSMTTIAFMKRGSIKIAA